VEAEGFYNIEDKRHVLNYDRVSLTYSNRLNESDH